jgi:hypothetical protein
MIRHKAAKPRIPVAPPITVTLSIVRSRPGRAQWRVDAKGQKLLLFRNDRDYPDSVSRLCASRPAAVRQAAIWLQHGWSR